MTWPLALVLVPLVGTLPLIFAGRRGRGWVDGWAVAATGATFASVVSTLPAVLRDGAIESELPAALGALTFSLNGFGLLVALAASLVWWTSTIYAGPYLHGRRERRFHLASLASLAAMLGVLIAGDLITLYVFFEWLGLVAYLVVVHEGGPAAERAGLKYLVLTLLGGLALLTGVLLVHGLGGGDLSVAVPMGEGREGVRAWAAGFLIAGFGVKAGLLGLHVWLPDAHTAAPAPGSAILSGVMIKAGVVGLARTLGVLYGAPPSDAGAGVDAGLAPGTALPLGESIQLGETLRWAGSLPLGETLALALMGIGLAGALAGAAMALWQHEAKRLLAYSSVSQMGFVLVGVGAARYLGADGAVGWTGAFAHIANHAVFKGLLFLGLGAVIHATGVGDLRRLGGLARRMPWTFAFVLVAAGGIVGVPGLNGFASKSVLHHAVAEAAEHGHVAGMALLEPLFTLGTIGTAAALVKLVAMTFLGRSRLDAGVTVHATPWRMRGAMGALAAVVVILGIVPQSVAPLLTGGLASWGVPAGDVAARLTGPLSHGSDLRAALLALVLGAAVHAVAARAGAYAVRPPAWSSLDRILVGLATAGVRLARAVALGHEQVAESVEDLADRRAAARAAQRDAAGKVARRPVPSAASGVQCRARRRGVVPVARGAGGPGVHLATPAQRRLALAGRHGPANRLPPGPDPPDRGVHADRSAASGARRRTRRGGRGARGGAGPTGARRSPRGSAHQSRRRDGHRRRVRDVARPPRRPDGRRRLNEPPRLAGRLVRRPSVMDGAERISGRQAGTPTAERIASTNCFLGCAPRTRFSLL
ncbi:MAG: complex I subunit 5 family protein [Trueperaceae bacterium]|nr:complex I subunit 5 family protein [Trueperaceae bacterium]